VIPEGARDDGRHAGLHQRLVYGTKAANYLARLRDLLEHPLALDP